MATQRPFNDVRSYVSLCAVCRCYEADEGPPQSSLTLLRPQLGTKEIDEWIKQPPRQLPQILSTARWS